MNCFPTKSISLLLALLLFRVFAVSAQTASMPTDYGAPKFTQAALQEDYALLRRALEEVHPALYRFTDSTAMTNLLDGIDKRISHEMTEREFWTLISPILGAVDCGHTRFYPSKNYRAHFRDHAKTFPFDVAIVADHLYIAKNLSADSTIAVGTEIVSINKLSVHKMLPQFLSRTWADGHNLTMRHRILEQVFHIWYNLILGDADAFTIQVIAPGMSKKRNLKVPAIDVIDRQNITLRRYPESTQQEALALKLLDGPSTVAALSVKTFETAALERMGIDFEHFLDSAFAVIRDRQVKKLVIDIRDNNGGDPALVRKLYAHIAMRPFPLLHHAAFKVDRPVTYLDAETLDFYKFEDDSLGRHLWIDAEHDWYGSYAPSRDHFDGAVYVLINGGSFSAAGFFGSLVHSAQRGTFIGVEAGGGSSCNDCHATIILPHTQIRAEIPRCTFSMIIPGLQDDGHRVMPDYLVTPTVADLIAGRDAALEFALGL